MAVSEVRGRAAPLHVTADDLAELDHWEQYPANLWLVSTYFEAASAWSLGLFERHLQCSRHQIHRGDSMTERARLRTFVACNCPAGYAVRSATAIVDVLPEQLGGWISGTARQRPIAASLAPYLYDPRSKMTLVGKPAELVMRALARRNLLDAFAEAAGATELKPANWTWPSPDRRIDVQVCDDGSLQLTENVPTFSVATAVDAADAACGRT